MPKAKLAVAVLSGIAVSMMSVVPAFADTNSHNTFGVPIEHHQTLVALGDSITFGYHLPGSDPATGTPSPLAFPFMLGRIQGGDAVDDLGVPGWTSAQLLGALQNSATFQQAVKTASVVTVDIGSNDLLGQASADGVFDPGQTPAQLNADVGTLESQVPGILAALQTNMGAILGDINNLNPDATVVVYNLYNPISKQESAVLNAAGNQLLGYMNPIIAGTAAVYHDPVADAYDAFAGRQQYLILPGDVHPNRLGQLVLAGVGEQALLQSEASPAMHRFAPWL